jgi:hypothetical protein
MPFYLFFVISFQNCHVLNNNAVAVIIVIWRECNRFPSASIIDTEFCV